MEITERKIINDLSEIYDGKKLLIKDFNNMDLSDIDLSTIPMEQWEDCIFYNTNLKNTGIKFIPNKLKAIPISVNTKAQMESYYYYEKSYINFCDFSDNDLTYLQPIDFHTPSGGEISTYGCNFSNTGINFLKTLMNVVLDSSYASYDFDSEYWNIGSSAFNLPEFIDIKTIIKNPFLNVPSWKFLNAIMYYTNDIAGKNSISIDWRYDSNGKLEWGISGGPSIVKSIIAKQCEEFLEYDKQGYGKKLYEKLKPFMSWEQRFEFFRFEIIQVNIKNVDFEDIPVDVLRYYHLKKNNFENVTINYKINDLFKFWKEGEYIIDSLSTYKNEYKSVYFSSIGYDSWQENDGAKKQVSYSAITFFTKVYLELSRDCNANCPFCRNDSFEKNNYDLEKIKNTLSMIKNYINAVVIGGGEPTLRLDDVKSLHQRFLNSKIDWHMFTNGTSKEIIDDDYIMDNFKINLSRHAIDDKENASIFSANSKSIMTSKDIERLNSRNGKVTLNATCFKGGLDSLKKIIEYIKFAKEIGCKKVLIQDLQKNTSLGCKNIEYNSLCLDNYIFEQLLEYLNTNYKVNYPVYATGGYASYIFRDKDKFSIAVQKYITPEDLKNGWGTAIKKVFDLSIDPSGNLYENWNQTTGLVKRLKK